jgi:hypothetical protein
VELVEDEATPDSAGGARSPVKCSWRLGGRRCSSSGTLGGQWLEDEVALMMQWLRCSWHGGSTVEAMAALEERWRGERATAMRGAAGGKKNFASVWKCKRIRANWPTRGAVSETVGAAGKTAARGGLRVQREPVAASDAVGFTSRRACGIGEVLARWATPDQASWTTQWMVRAQLPCFPIFKYFPNFKISKVHV